MALYCFNLKVMYNRQMISDEYFDFSLSLPSLKRIDNRVLCSGTEVKPQTSFEAMCLSQAKVFTELANSLLLDVGYLQYYYLTATS